MGFRYTSSYIAKKLGLTGWVDNRPDGSVEMEVQGSISLIRKLLIRLKAQQHILIEDMEIREIPPDADEKGFRVRGSRY